MKKRLVLSTFVVLAVWLLTGLSLGHIPDYELTCATTKLMQVCAESGCITPVLVKIGNSGNRTATRITVTLPARITEGLALEPKLLRFGKVSQNYSREAPNRIVFGPLDPPKWVELSLFVRGSALDDVLECTDLIAAPPAKVVAGSPEWLRLGRFLYAIFSSFLLLNA
jgi:hypothetical protein